MCEKKCEHVVHGTAASPGVAHGAAFVFLDRAFEAPHYEVEAAKSNREIKRFRRALEATREQVNSIKAKIASKLNEQEAQIFDVHLMVLEDQALIDETIQMQRDSNCNIDHCFHEVSKRYITSLHHIQDDYLRERAVDLEDVTRRVLHNLLGQQEARLDALHDGRIVIAENLTPSETALMDEDKVLAIVTDRGSRTSHTVIVARRIPVPAVVGLHDITTKVHNGDDVLVDGYNGIVILHPTQETLTRYSTIRSAHDSLRKIYAQSVELPSETADGHRLALMANIEGPEELDAVSQAGAEGVGLFRTEGLFLNRETAPDEAEQFAIYRTVVESMKPHPVVIRTLDLGGDKPWKGAFFAEREKNPFMGLRAIRLCLEHKDIFKTQLRALLRAALLGDVNLMYPMISGLEELQQANAVLEEAKEDLRKRGEPFASKLPIGTMIELPSAAYTADILAQHCTFFSIGTNDLIQYMMAVDRVNDKVAHLYNPNHPAVLRALKTIIDAAKRSGIPVSICGEMAGDSLYTGLLLGLGADSLSAAPQYLNEIKYLVRTIRFPDAVALAHQALECRDSESVYALLRTFYNTHMAPVLSKVTV